MPRAPPPGAAPNLLPDTEPAAEELQGGAGPAAAPGARQEGRALVPADAPALTERLRCEGPLSVGGLTLAQARPAAPPKETAAWSSSQRALFKKKTPYRAPTPGRLIAR